MNNNILRLAKLTTRILIFGDILLGSILIILMIVWQIDVGFFEDIRVVHDGSIFKFTNSNNAEGMPLSKYSSFYFYFLVLRALIIVGVLYLILQTAQRIIKSIGDLDTFRSENVTSFRRMGNLFLIWFVLAIPTIKIYDDAASISVGFYFNYAVWALISFVLAEIFSEGNKLMEDSKLTI
ncbi:DUF2975 domain-containing protein [Ekhidna sp.]|uniref:DUF2975 domain-containing protein n=1 Tax=Ekhidna sp. TaxID=2608089 RepID=UPI003B4FFA53